MFHSQNNKTTEVKQIPVKRVGNQKKKKKSIRNQSITDGALSRFFSFQFLSKNKIKSRHMLALTMSAIHVRAEREKKKQHIWYKQLLNAMQSSVLHNYITSIKQRQH